jgi:hypothetical protein
LTAENWLQWLEAVADKIEAAALADADQTTIYAYLNAAELIRLAVTELRTIPPDD